MYGEIRALTSSPGRGIQGGNADDEKPFSVKGLRTCGETL